MRRPAVAILLLLLGACAPATEYVRAGTPAVQRDADEQDCQRIAAEQALDESFASGPKYPPLRDTQFTVDGGGAGEPGGGITASYSRRGARQYELAEYCMQQRGYRLVQVAE
ncbi:hypothetical protein [Ferrovibrio sp.]|uniref:hypothetical protein n=1 Tax=Ferrovibrio sp. TaxID=1917215 RepID=UPI00311E3531